MNDRSARPAGRLRSAAHSAEEATCGPARGQCLHLVGRRRRLPRSSRRSCSSAQTARSSPRCALRSPGIACTSRPRRADAVAETVIAAAPDLVLLVGPAARDGGSSVLQTLMSSPVCSVIPVAILDDNTALDMRLRAFRHGAAAVIAPSASIDAIAEQVAKLAREIPERGGESLGVVGEATLSEFVGALSSELRSGILSVHTGKGNEDAVRLVLGSGRPLAAFIDDFVRQVKSHVVHAEPLQYEFAEHAGGTVTLARPRGAFDRTRARQREGRARRARRRRHGPRRQRRSRAALARRVGGRDRSWRPRSCASPSCARSIRRCC